MKLVVAKLDKVYCISFKNHDPDDILDKHIADYLDIQLENYRSILLKYNATTIPKSGEYIFIKKKDAIKVLLVLEPYLILAELTK